MEVTAEVTWFLDERGHRGFESTHKVYLINSFTSLQGWLHSKLDSRDLYTVYGANIKSRRLFVVKNWHENCSTFEVSYWYNLQPSSHEFLMGTTSFLFRFINYSYTRSIEYVQKSRPENVQNPPSSIPSKNYVLATWTIHHPLQRGYMATADVSFNFLDSPCRSVIVLTIHFIVISRTFVVRSFKSSVTFFMGQNDTDSARHLSFCLMDNFLGLVSARSLLSFLWCHIQSAPHDWPTHVDAKILGQSMNEALSSTTNPAMTTSVTPISHEPYPRKTENIDSMTLFIDTSRINCGISFYDDLWKDFDDRI